VLRRAVIDLAETRDATLANWIRDEAAFPSTMVDRITPVPSPAEIAAFERRTGLADRAALMAEPFRQWVIEDDFTAGRPAWEKVGAQIVRDVAPYERMKLRLLNASHLAIAGLGFLAGYARIDETMHDPLIRRYMAALMDRETGPTLDPVPGIDLAAYKGSLVERFSNPAIGDTVARVNADAALNYLLDPIRDRLARGASVDLLALGLAAWLRRVRGEDEVGRPVAVVHPLADRLRDAALAGGADPMPLLSIRILFGDLGDDSRLVGAVGTWLAALYEKGVQGTLETAAARGLF
jgi:mannitol 2-dehydrogenase